MNRFDHILVAASLLAGARIVSARTTVVDTIAIADRAASCVGPLRFLRRTCGPPETARMVSSALETATRFVPGALCLHRAAAGRVWLASFGIESRIVVGLRRDSRWQGHAWLEVEHDDDRILLFTEEVPFEPVFRGHRD